MFPSNNSICLAFWWWAAVYLHWGLSITIVSFSCPLFIVWSSLVGIISIFVPSIIHFLCRLEKKRTIVLGCSLWASTQHQLFVSTWKQEEHQNVSRYFSFFSRDREPSRALWHLNYCSWLIVVSFLPSSTFCVVLEKGGTQRHFFLF